MTYEFHEGVKGTNIVTHQRESHPPAFSRDILRSSTYVQDKVNTKYTGNRCLVRYVTVAVKY